MMPKAKGIFKRNTWPLHDPLGVNHTDINSTKRKTEKRLTISLGHRQQKWKEMSMD